MTIPLDYLKTTALYLKRAIEVLEETPSLTINADLLQALEQIDLRYNEWCNTMDMQWGQTEGTSYEDGISMEFYLEATDWHKVSVILRKLKMPQ
jgi:hypothetical protein